jgi:hypothetical protein
MSFGIHLDVTKWSLVEEGENLRLDPVFSVHCS